ncbi:MAG: hypothetical protein R3E48_11220 [Burkholderiaceae bacterium]
MKTDPDANPRHKGIVSAFVAEKGPWSLSRKLEVGHGEGYIDSAELRSTTIASPAPTS